MPVIMAAWAAFRSSAIFRYAAIAMGAVAAFLIAMRRAERRGRKEAVREAQEKDEANAEAIRGRADDARRDFDPDGLSDHPARRD